MPISSHSDSEGHISGGTVMNDVAPSSCSNSYQDEPEDDEEEYGEGDSASDSVSGYAHNHLHTRRRYQSGQGLGLRLGPGLGLASEQGLGADYECDDSSSLADASVFTDDDTARYTQLHIYSPIHISTPPEPPFPIPYKLPQILSILSHVSSCCYIFSDVAERVDEMTEKNLAHHTASTSPGLFSRVWAYGTQKLWGGSGDASVGANARVNNRFSAGVRVGVLDVRTEGLGDRGGGLVPGRRSRRRSSVATSIASAVMITTTTTHLINN